MRISQAMFSKGFGGAERSFVDTVSLLSRAGHEVQALCHVDFMAQDRLEMENVTVEPLNISGEWNPLSQHAVSRAIERYRPDLVHAHLRRAAWFAGKAGHMAGIPVVAKLHNYVDLTRYRYVNTLIATTADECRYALAQGWSPNRVTIIPNFSSLPVRNPQAAPTGQPLRLLSYGRFVRKKGFDLLLQAAAELRDEGLEFVLTLGGEGAEQAALEAIIADRGLSDSVKMIGWVEDVVPLLEQADLFILPSRSEPFGIVILEAMACGVPIVSTWAEGPREILDGTTTYFASVDSQSSLTDAMRRAMADSEGRLQHAQNALATFREHYSEGAFRLKLLELYKQLAQETHRKTDSVGGLA